MFNKTETIDSRAGSTNTDLVTGEGLENWESAVEFFTAGKFGDNHPFQPKLRGFTGLSKVYQSFAVAVPTKSSRAWDEWDPFAQRPIIYPLNKNTAEPILTTGFSRVQNAAKSLVSLSHEMMHSFLWEPFFTGRHQVSNAAKFVNMSMMGEGFCFFYADIVVTPRLRERFPDGEFIFERSSMSVRTFHPYRAFLAAGVTDMEEILQAYLDGFRVGDVEAFGNGNFGLSLGRRIREFFNPNREFSGKLHLLLKTCGIWDEFWGRFCNVPGIPSLLENSIMELAEAEDPNEYFLSIYRDGLPALESLSPARVRRVYLRRGIQNRAYFAHKLRFICKQNWLIAKKLNARDRGKLVSGIGHYLNALESALRALCDSRPESEILDLVQEADQAYERDVRARFIERDVWSSRMYFINPSFGAPSIGMDVFDGPELRPARLTAINAFMCKELVHVLDPREEPSKCHRRLELVSRLSGIQGRLDLQSDQVSLQIRRELKRLFREPEMLRIWSAPLEGFDPAHNRFQEHLYVYD